VIVVLVTPNTATKGPDIDTPIKSPMFTTPTADVDVVITDVVELKLLAVMPELLGIAPTHCATRLTNALAD
jgi:hypothetical protein